MGYIFMNISFRLNNNIRLQQSIQTYVSTNSDTTYLTLTELIKVAFISSVPRRVFISISSAF